MWRLGRCWMLELLALSAFIMAPAIGFALYCAYQAEINSVYEQHFWYVLGLIGILGGGVVLVATVPGLSIG